MAIHMGSSPASHGPVADVRVVDVLTDARVVRVLEPALVELRRAPTACEPANSPAHHQHDRDCDDPTHGGLPPPRSTEYAAEPPRGADIASSCPSSQTGHTLSAMELLPSAHVDTFCRDHLPPAEQWPELTFDLPELQYPDRLNCATALLDDVAARHGGDRPCLHQPGVPTWTYADLVTAANRIARVLVDDLGVVPGNRVLLRGPNNQWLSAAWFGVLKAGAVLVTTMPLLRTGELRTIHEIARLDAALVDHRFLEAVDPLGVPTIPYGDDAWTERMADTDPAFDDIDTSSDDVCMLAFTSGTT